MNRKMWKKILIMFICIILVQSPAANLIQPVSVQAATVKQGLKKEKGQYYYYQNGKKVKDKWIKIGSYSYYFGKDGKAFKAPKYTGKVFNIVSKKVRNKAYYGFDYKGRRLKGITATYKGVIHAYDKKTGVLDSKLTKKLRNASVYGKDAKTLRSLMGKPKKTQVLDSCYAYQGKIGKDIILTYDYVTVYLYRIAGTNKEIVFGVEAR